MKTGYVEGVEGVLLDVEDAIAALSEPAAREVRVRLATAFEQTAAESKVRFDRERFQALREDPGIIEGVAGAAPLGGTQFDLPIALSLAGVRADGAVVVGELALNGVVRRVRGIVPILIKAHEHGLKRAIVPASQVQEARVVPGITLVPVADLRAALAGEESPVPGPERLGTRPWWPDSSDLTGATRAWFDEAAKAVGDGENVLLVGPPGAGKTMIARRLMGHLPGRTGDGWELELAAIRSASGLGFQWPPQRPFRAPHYTASTAAILGGGRSGRIRPGEATLAHGGLLFLDELPEFGRRELDGLARAVCAGEVRMHRRSAVSAIGLPPVVMPASPVVVAAMNSCPCGHFASASYRLCRCTKERVQRYNERVRFFVDALGMKVVLMVEPSLRAESEKLLDN